MQPAPDRPAGTVEIVSEARVDHDVAPAAGPATGSAPASRATRARINSTVRSPASAGSRCGHRIEDRDLPPPRAEIRVGNDVILRDLGSTNGTYVNGALVAEQPLRDGAVVTIGSTNLTFRSAP